jgi:GDP-L-fucose synthase
MNNYNEPGIINVGVGEDISINELAQLIKKVVGFEGHIKFDISKPDGTPVNLWMFEINGFRLESICATPRRFIQVI